MSDGHRKGRRRVRPVSRDGRFARLRSTPCFKEAYDRIVAGWPMTEVARFIQQDRREYTDVSESSLASLLQDFRSSLPPSELVARRMPKVYQEKVKELEEGIDEVKELEKLYEIQMARIQIDLSTEKKINKLLPSMTQEIREARHILESIAQVKMDLGVTERHLGTVDMSATLVADMKGRYGSEAVARVLGDPEKVRKVLGVANELLQRGGADDVNFLLVPQEDEAAGDVGGGEAQEGAE